jgi:hypothetical protein
MTEEVRLFVSVLLRYNQFTLEQLRYSSTLSLTSALDGGGWSTPRRPLYLRERPGTHCIESWVGPKAGLDLCYNHTILIPNGAELFLIS